MNETNARKLCQDRHRNPDRIMTGPDGPLKAWGMYDARTLANEPNEKPDETRD